MTPETIDRVGAAAAKRCAEMHQAEWEMASMLCVLHSRRDEWKSQYPHLHAFLQGHGIDISFERMRLMVDVYRHYSAFEDEEIAQAAKRIGFTAAHALMSDTSGRTTGQALLVLKIVANRVGSASDLKRKLNRLRRRHAMDPVTPA